MGKVTLAPENKSKQYEGFPRFKLATGEKARICLIDADPERVYVHAYRMPVVVNGKPVTEIKQGRNGEYEKVKTEYVDQFACDGDEDVLKDAGLDPANCKQCQEAKNDPTMFSPPAPKYAQNILRYKTKPGTFQVADPFQAEVVAWVYSDGRFGTLCDIAGEHAPKHGGSMRGVDLLVGPCKSGEFQNYDIQAGAECEWTADDERQAWVAKLYKNAKCETLTDLIARKASPTALSLTLDKVRARYAQIGNPSAGVSTFEPTSMEGLLDGVGKGEEPSTSAAPLKENSGFGAPEPSSAEDAPVTDFTSLLDSLEDD